MKKVLILTTTHTGHGHKSISDALTEQLLKFPNVAVETVEAFSLLGKAAIRGARTYGPITRFSKDLWGLTFQLSTYGVRAGNEIVSLMAHDKFMKKLSIVKPDVIVTVHSVFNGSILNILEEHSIHIPFLTVQADMVDIHPSWCDPRATKTLSPMPEAYDASLAYGMPKNRLVRVSFPTRARFTDAARTALHPPYDPARHMQCLIMSGGEGAGSMKKYAVQMLNHFNCNVTVICGRNAKLKAALEEQLAPIYGERLTILGFCENVQEYMLKSDLIAARGSPNTLMEAIVCACPLLITGSLPGQEEHNPAIMASRNLGVECDSPLKVASIVGELLKDGAEKLHAIQDSQLAFRDLNAAKHIAEIIIANAKSKRQPIPPFKLKFPLNLRAKYMLRQSKKQFRRIRGALKRTLE